MPVSGTIANAHIDLVERVSGLDLWHVFWIIDEPIRKVCSVPFQVLLETFR